MAARREARRRAADFGRRIELEGARDNRHRCVSIGLDTTNLSGHLAEQLEVPALVAGGSAGR